jgi:cAMP-binding proteins - catabolite gene activator and regulatory subunit of cAMP-dependent protein kinases
MEYEASLGQFTLLKVIPMDFWNRNDSMKKKIVRKKYAKDEIIHFDGDICTHIEIIIEGEVLIERIDESGNLMKISEFFPDDILGGNLLFSKNPHYPMTVTAKTATNLIALEKSLVFELCTNSPDFLAAFLEYISDHALLLGDKIKHYVNRSIRESIMAYLKNEYHLQNSNRIQLHSTKKELADRIGVQRTSLSRELQKMKKEGLVDYDTESITILDRYLHRFLTL